MLAVLLAAAPARAQSDEYRPGPWYGWQLILADAAAVTMMTVPVSPGAGPLTRGLGVTAFFMNGPIIHMAPPPVACPRPKRRFTTDYAPWRRSAAISGRSNSSAQSMGVPP